MDLNPISSILDILIKSADLTKKLEEIYLNFSLSNEVKNINAKLDQDITRKIRTGYEKIKLALRKSADAASRAEDLEDARRALLDCVNLNEKLETDGISNGKVEVVAHIGLATIYHLKGDAYNTSHHMLKAFATDPRQTRAYFPEIYKQLFESSCGALVSPLDRAAATRLAELRLEKPNADQDELIKTATEIGKGVLKGATWAAAAAAFVLSAGRINFGVIGSGVHSASEGIDSIRNDAAIVARHNQKISRIADEMIQENETSMRKQDSCCKDSAQKKL